MNYYKIIDDDTADRWHLSLPRDKNGEDLFEWKFNLGKICNENREIFVDIKYGGEPLDFTLCAFEIPVVNDKIINLLSDYITDNLQVVPIIIPDILDKFYILNILNVVDCVDEDRSEFIKWTKNDHRSDLAGDYREITELYIDQIKAKGNKIFRLGGWEMEIVVNEEIVSSFKSAKTTGILFGDIS